MAILLYTGNKRLKNC
uniref:Uncharacterized protein n=1 Tax=Anguilla anguilla TaxID=7936 RepID=A0A0E9SE60_ANGAN